MVLPRTGEGDTALTEPVRVAIQRLDPGVPLPAYAHEGDAGLDLAAAETVHLAPGERALVSTGVAVALPPGCAGLVVPRSGLAWRHGVTVLNAPGLIDAGYRGELKVLLANLGQEPVTFERGERIVQLVVVQVVPVRLDPVAELPPSQRGPGGFGSTGR